MMNVALLAAWLLHLMMLAVPPGRAQSETKAEQTARYGLISRSIAVVTLDEKEAPVYGDGKVGSGREKTATLLLAISLLESGWRREVDVGTERGDGGASCTIFQLHLGPRKTPEGWGCDELVADREKATRAALGALRRSAGACKRVPGPEAVLLLYVAGTCDGERPAAAVFGPGVLVRDVALLRVEQARRWAREHPIKAFRAEHPELLEEKIAEAALSPGK